MVFLQKSRKEPRVVDLLIYYDSITKYIVSLILCGVFLVTGTIGTLIGGGSYEASRCFSNFAELE